MSQSPQVVWQFVVASPFLGLCYLVIRLISSRLVAASKPRMRSSDVDNRLVYADLAICFQCVLCGFFLLNIYDQNVTVTSLGRDWDVLYDKFSAKNVKRFST